MAGDVLPTVMEVVLAPVGDHHPAEGGRMPNSRNEARVRSQEEQRARLGDHVLLGPGGPAAQRGLIEPGHERGGDQRLDQLHHIRDHPGRPGQARVDETCGDLRAGHVRDQPRAHRAWMLSSRRWNTDRAARSDLVIPEAPLDLIEVVVSSHDRRAVPSRRGRCW
jgi:hypothetical protein